MHTSILSLISVSLLLVACQTPTPLAVSPRGIPALQAASNPKTAQQAPLIQTPTALPANASQAEALYGFRRPVGTMEVNMFSAGDRELVMTHVKEFFRKYVDQNDIVNYQVLSQEGGDGQIFFLNIYGGKTEFVLNKLLPDLKYYLNQRVRVYKLTHYASR
jgi:hypothetical protein